MLLCNGMKEPERQSRMGTELVLQQQEIVVLQKQLMKEEQAGEVHSLSEPLKEKGQNQQLEGNLHGCPDTAATASVTVPAPQWPIPARVICVTIKQSYNRGCTIAQWLRRSFLKRKVPTGCLQTVCLRRLIRPMARSCFILTDYDAVSACHSRSEPCANATTRERGEWSCHTEQWSTTPSQGLRNFS
jgi:hypothetical protein